MTQYPTLDTKIGKDAVGGVNMADQIFRVLHGGQSDDTKVEEYFCNHCGLDVEQPVENVNIPDGWLSVIDNEEEHSFCCRPCMVAYYLGRLAESGQPVSRDTVRTILSDAETRDAALHITEINSASNGIALNDMGDYVRAICTTGDPRLLTTAAILIAIGAYKYDAPMQS